MNFRYLGDALVRHLLDEMVEVLEPCHIHFCVIRSMSTYSKTFIMINFVFHGISKTCNCWSVGARGKQTKTVLNCRLPIWKLLSGPITRFYYWNGKGKCGGLMNLATGRWQESAERRVCGSGRAEQQRLMSLQPRGDLSCTVDGTRDRRSSRKFVCAWLRITFQSAKVGAWKRLARFPARVRKQGKRALYGYADLSLSIPD